MILAFIGAELAGGRADSASPLPGRVILDPIPGRGLKAWYAVHAGIYAGNVE